MVDSNLLNFHTKQTTNWHHLQYAQSHWYGSTPYFKPYLVAWNGVLGASVIATNPKKNEEQLAWQNTTCIVYANISLGHSWELNGGSLRCSVVGLMGKIIDLPYIIVAWWCHALRILRQIQVRQGAAGYVALLLKF